MSENWVKTYQKEEEFLEDFSDLAHEAARTLNNEWEPNSACSDKARHNRDYFLSSGELQALDIRLCLHIPR